MKEKCTDFLVALDDQCMGLELTGLNTTQNVSGDKITKLFPDICVSYLTFSC